MMGSHIDSVPEGGNYDGDVGVLGAIEVALTPARAGHRHAPPARDRGLHRRGRRHWPAAGRWPADRPRARHRQPQREDVRDGIRAVGGDPDALDERRRKPGEITAFVELHIEQGAILDESGIDIGVVEGIVGIRWWDVTVEGVANHAGTTPMDRRRDALLAAAELGARREPRRPRRRARRSRRSADPRRTRRAERHSGPRRHEPRDPRPRGREDDPFSGIAAKQTHRRRARHTDPVRGSRPRTRARPDRRAAA